MRSLVFTLSAINALLNALVIALFMQPEVIVVYNMDGTAAMKGSRWLYLIWVAVPLIISGALLLSQKLSEKSKPSNDESDADSNAENENPIDQILNDSGDSGDNWGMVLTWVFAIISWVLTGIALNNIENVGVILPSIIVLMLSAVFIFFSSFYNSVSSYSVCGIRIKWIAGNRALVGKVKSVVAPIGLMGGLAGVCLAAWSLVISDNMPNCMAIVVLFLLEIVLPVFYSYILSKVKK